MKKINVQNILQSSLQNLEKFSLNCESFYDSIEEDLASCPKLTHLFINQLLYPHNSAINLPMVLKCTNLKRLELYDCTSNIFYLDALQSSTMVLVNLTSLIFKDKYRISFFQTIMNKFAFLFPNLKYLAIYRYLKPIEYQ